MEILASYDLTRCAWSAAQLAGCDPKTVQRYVDLRDAGLDPMRRTRRARLIDRYLDKVEELVEHSRGKIRADVAHDRLRAMGYAGNERDHASGGGGGEDGLPGRPPADVPTLGTGAGNVAAVRLGRRAAGGRSSHVPVLRLAGLVTVPGGAADLGPQAGHAAGLPGRHPAPAAGGADVPADRQRADGDHRAGGRGAGAAPGGGGSGPALWPGGPDL